jgi:hypothetical protein
MIMFRVDYFRFDLVFIKKNNQTEIKKTETGSNRPVSVRFFRTKTGSNQFGSVLARFFRFGLVFSGFFLFGFGSVFSIPGLKNRNRTGWFF